MVQISELPSVVSIYFHLLCCCNADDLVSPHQKVTCFNVTVGLLPVLQQSLTFCVCVDLSLNVLNCSALLFSSSACWKHVLNVLSQSAVESVWFVGFLERKILEKSLVFRNSTPPRAGLGMNSTSQTDPGDLGSMETRLIQNSLN